MGCDIHAYIEFRLGGTWEFHSEALCFRDYVLFGLLAGVRGSEEPLYLPRGLPDDLSFGVRWEYESEHSDAWHTPSWLDEKEFEVVLKKWKNPLRHTYVSAIASLSAMKACAKHGETRLVFWFDN